VLVDERDVAAADWYPDPAGKFEMRYWDGEAWTDQVAESGTVAPDPFFRPDASYAPPGSEPTTVVATVAPDRPPRSRKALVAALVAFVVVAAAVAAFALTRGGDSKQATVASSAATTESSSDTTTTESSTTTTTERATTTTTIKASDVVGLSIADATSKLRQSGKTVTVKEVIDETKPDGTVVEAAPGSNNSEVVVTVARGPVSRFHESVAEVNGDARTGLVDVNGTTYNHSVFTNVGVNCPGQVIEYDLGRDFRRFQTAFGISDEAPSTAKTRFEVFLDGANAATNDVGLGESLPVDLDVTGVLRLKLVATAIEGPTCGNRTWSSVWVDAKILGVPSEVPPETSSPSN
jgi:serine/threonine-protein kinase